MPRTQINSRGTTFRLMSDSESEFGTNVELTTGAVSRSKKSIPDVFSPNPITKFFQPSKEFVTLKRDQRHSSQSILPRVESIEEPTITRTTSVVNLPKVNPRDRTSTPGYVGEEAYSHYYKKYRRLSKEKEISPNGYSATTAYLASCEKQKMIPLPMGIVKWDGVEGEINCENYLMGRKYAMALSNSMKYLKTEKLNLQSNNLGGNG